MNARYLAVLFVLSLIAAVTLSSLSVRYKTANDHNQSSVSSLFRQLKLLSASADREILQLRTRTQTSFDQLAGLKLEHDNLVSQLEGEMQTVFNALDSQRLLAQYRVLSRRSESIISQFKSSIAYTENSFNYSFHLTDEILGALEQRGNEKAWNLTRQLQVDVLQHFTTQETISSGSIDRSVKGIQSLLQQNDVELIEMLSVLNRHLTILFQGQSEINAALANLFELERNKALDDAHALYLNRMTDNRQNELTFLIAAIASTLVLLLTIALAMYRFLRLNSEKESLSFAISESEASLQRSNTELMKEVEQRVEAEQELKNAAIMYENCPLGVIICDADQRVITANPAYEKITGAQCADMIGQLPAILSEELLPAEILSNIKLAIKATGKWQGEMPVITARGTVIPAEVSIIATRKDSQLSRYIIMLADISERKKNEDVIYQQANFDALTLLPNRNLFDDRVAHTLADSTRNHKKFALLFVDIDNFKRINDTLGHTVGDELLQIIAGRLSASVREVDTLSRFGGDEFVLVIEDIKDVLQIEPLLTKLIRCISEPVTVSSVQHPALHVSGSIGVSVFPDDGKDLSTLIRCADMAMYKAKEQGKNTYCFYQEKMTAEAHEYMALETQLRSALGNAELFLAYQPIYTLKGYTADSVEALIRWRTSAGELITPDRFIPVAEDSGMIIGIGEWVLRRACQQLARWHQTVSPDIRIAVNISVVQFRDPGFGAMLKQVIEYTGITPGSLILEITESLFLDDTDNKVYPLLTEIRDLGVLISLDDFGTGYASLSYLKRFPVDIIKIDRSFIADLSDDKDDGSLVEAIINMARSLNMEVVAEGVETAEQLEWLKAAGCDKAQGFYCSRPEAEAEITPLLLSDRRMTQCESD
ncbi:MAG: EAL domain-containing protein [Amphritea sp.]|nr:EAL domain-containing protein [Amphritea sp.]